MIQNRYAVYLQDIFEYKESISVCEDALEIVRDMHGVLSSISHKMGVSTADFRSVQMGKLLGTEVQAYTNLIEMENTLYPKASELSDLAIKQFDMPMDIQRQFQYRAVLEASAGKYNSSLKWLEEYYGMPWKEYLSQKNTNIFGIMNLSRIADYMSASSEPTARSKGEAIVKAICEEILAKGRIRIDMGYPAVCIYYYIGKNVIKKDKKEGELYLSQVINNGNQNTNLVYQMFALRARLLKIEKAYKDNGIVSTKELEKFDRLLEKKRKNAFNVATLNEIDKIAKMRQSIV